MAKRFKYLLFLVFSGLLTVTPGCIDDEGFDNSPVGNFDALWHVIDERYCFFAYKDIDWNEVYSRYRPMVNESTNNQDLFNVMAKMLYELEDGHVNLVTPFDQARYWKWFEDYPINYYAETVNKYYLKQPDYKIAGSMRYRILDGTNIGYVYYGNFSSGVGDGNLDEILFAFYYCDGIIIDVRSNGGGLVTNVEKIVSRFIKNEMVSGYMRHKISPAHNGFSDYYPVTIKPASSGRVKYYGPVAVLTNRSCFSATNDFVSVMKQLPQVAVIGDKTGGGGGLPFSSELPNGWSLRFSASPIVNAAKEEIEFGVDPTEKVNLAPLTAGTTTDAIIDAAVSWINSKSGN